MVMRSANSSIVAGRVVEETIMENVTIKVLRGFLFKGKAVAVGTLLEVPADVAGELVAMHKAEKYVPPPPRPSRKVEAAVKVEEPKNDQQ